MKVAKKLYIANIIAYASFMILVAINLEKDSHGLYVLFAFLPYVTVLYTTFIFNTRFDKRLKKILVLSISDFIIRVIAMVVNFNLSSFTYIGKEFKILFLVMILLFISNIFIEYLIGVKLTRIGARDITELTTHEIIANGSEGVIIKTVVSFKETVVLYIMYILVLGYKASLGLGYIFIYIVPFILLMYVYIISTYDTLFSYYKNKNKARRIFIYENSYILLMFVLMGILVIFKHSDDGEKFLIYLIISLLSLPRYFSRRKRMKEIYKNHMIKKNTHL